MTLSFLRLPLVCAALAAVAPAFAAEPAIIAKARAYVGPESTLEGLKSVHFVGTLITADPKDPKKEIRAAMEIIFQRPDQQRIKSTSDTTIEVTALDGYDGWQRIEDAKNPAKWQQTLLGTDQIKRLRANTWENLAFYRGIERRGGKMEDQGTQTIDGVNCQKIAFIHAPNIIFYRFFDVATGRLVYTETESGGNIRESGEMRAGGLRFPKSIVTAMKGTAGVQTVTINFEKVTINESFPNSLFSVPPIPRQ
jgi:hypothetical protein